MRVMVRAESERTLWVSKLSKDIEYGKERSETLEGMSSLLHFPVKDTTNPAKGLDDKDIEDSVTRLVKTDMSS